MKNLEDQVAWKPLDPNDLAKKNHDEYSHYDGTKNRLRKAYSSFSTYYHHFFVMAYSLLNSSPGADLHTNSINFDLGKRRALNNKGGDDKKAIQGILE